LYGEKGTSRNEKGYKSENLYNAEFQQYDYTKDTSSNEKGYKSNEENRPSPNEKVTKLSNKKIRYIIVILLMLGSPLSVGLFFAGYGNSSHQCANDHQHHSQYARNSVVCAFHRGIIEQFQLTIDN